MKVKSALLLSLLILVVGVVLIFLHNFDVFTALIIGLGIVFIIPGIIAAYSYAMTGYILAEHPELTAGEAIDRSKQMMYGNRWRLFCLQFSFIGWDILSSLSLGIGTLWLRPYKQAATAAFYRDISGTEYTVSPEEHEPVLYIAEE